MTNREYLESLSDEEFVNAIYSVIIPTGKQFTSSRSGLTQWMKQEKGIEWELPQWTLFRNLYER